MLPVCEILEKNNCTTNVLTTLAILQNHHVVGDDDHNAEDGHHIQPVFGSTDHATSCSVQSGFSEAA